MIGPLLTIVRVSHVLGSEYSIRSGVHVRKAFGHRSPPRIKLQAPLAPAGNDDHARERRLVGLDPLTWNGTLS